MLKKWGAMKREISNCYNGNFKIKRAGIQHHYTQSEIDELIKCRDDPVYFFSTYVKIVHLDKGLVHFEPYDYQKDIVQMMSENRFSIFLMPRQMGKCCRSNINIKVRNKKTGEIHELPIGEFFERRRAEKPLLSSDKEDDKTRK